MRRSMDLINDTDALHESDPAVCCGSCPIGEFGCELAGLAVAAADGLRRPADDVAAPLASWQHSCQFAMLGFCRCADGMSSTAIFARTP